MVIRLKKVLRGLGRLALVLLVLCAAVLALLGLLRWRGLLLFAQEEPKLYQLLFVNSSREAASFADVFGELGPMAERCVEAIRRDYALSDGDARLLFEHVWIYTFGLGTLCAGGARFSQERLQGMLSTSFRALLTLAKTGQLGETGTKP